jgi:hypothetical protein
VRSGEEIPPATWPPGVLTLPGGRFERFRRQPSFAKLQGELSFTISFLCYFALDKRNETI